MFFYIFSCFRYLISMFVKKKTLLREFLSSVVLIQILLITAKTTLDKFLHQIKILLSLKYDYFIAY